MERYHIYKLGIAILFYAIYCRRPMLVNCSEVDDAIGNVNDTSHKISAREYFVYYQGVQGRPGIDFPVFSRIPRTSFSCKEVESGYYADLETDCQVFHICNEGTKVSFLCPNGTIFQQADLICDWWFKVNCTNSPNLYEESAEQLRESIIRRKASRRVYGNNAGSFESQDKSNERPNSYNNDNNQQHQHGRHNRPQQVHLNNRNQQETPPRSNNNNNHLNHNNNNNNHLNHNNNNNNNRQNNNNNYYGNNYNANRQTSENKMSRKVDVITGDNRQGRQRHVFAVDNSGSVEEMQIPQESGSFIQDYNKRVTTNPYPNHRETYSDIQDPKTYYTNKPNNANTLNNGKPFVVSTPKIGSYTTEKTTFKYSPTVPSIKKLNYITPLPTSTSTKKYMSTYGERIRLANTFANKAPNPVPKTYSNVETFTSPPSVANGKSTTPRKPKPKTSFSIGLNSVQGSVAFKTQSASINTTNHQTKPKTTNKGVIKLNLSSDGPAKPVSKQFTQKPIKPKVRLDFGDLEVPKLELSTDNEIPSATNRPANGFYVTKSTFRPGEYATSNFNAGSITGSKNTYIPTTGRPVTTTTSRPETTTFTYISNTFGFVKPTGVPKPKPFELPSSTTPKTRTTTDNYYDTTNIPNYQISSASPFTNVPPTLPSIYNGKNYVGSTPGSPFRPEAKKDLPENVGNMLQTLQEIANVRFGKNENFRSIDNQPISNGNSNQDVLDSDKRPGLVVPPSVGPQTLHTLAVYFANALDSLVEESNTTATANPPAPAVPVEVVQNDPQDNTLISSLLSQDTVNKYKELFMIMAQKEMTEEADAEDQEQDDLQREHSNNAVQSPRVRQLAKVFTQALSSYLDDPDKFKQVLHGIRPTEPPPLNSLSSDSLNNDEDELLNFSDADIKPENPRLPTLAPPNPTWGYILAYNTSTTTDYKSNHIDQNDENLQSADSQSFIPGFNEINSNRVDKSLKQSGLPNNHWTSSPDVTKLWQSTLYVNPLQINQNFDATEPLISTSTEEAEEFDDDSTHATVENHDDTIHQPVDLTEYNTESYIDYELRSLPKFDLNSTSVHGLLIDFMNSSAYDENGRLQRILRKLNTTQDEFLSKMKEIEKNPLTKRLILLLVSECGNKTDAKTHAVRDIINLAHQAEDNAAHEQGQRHQRQQENEFLQVANSESLHNSLQKESKRSGRYQNRGRVNNSSIGRLVDPKIKEDDQDSRAIQLLNSLYSIASKYGK